MDKNCIFQYIYVIYRPSVLAAHQMPEPSRVPWNPAQMPWTSATQIQFRSNEVVEFKGDASADVAKFVHKRKADSDRLENCLKTYFMGFAPQMLPVYVIAWPMPQ